MIDISKYKSYFNNLSAYFGASLFPMLLSLLVNPWIAKNMSPEDYAISGFYTSFSSLISPIIVFYLIHYYIKEYFRCSEHERTQLVAIIAKSLIWFSGMVSIICFAALGIYLKYFYRSLTFPISPYLALMVFSLPLTGLYNLKLSQYRMKKQASSFFKITVGNGLLNIFLTVLFVIFLKWGAFGKLLAPLLCNLIVFLIMLFCFKTELKIETHLRDFKKIFIFCLPLALSAMLGYFTHGFSTTYLESIGKTTEYGIYVVGVSIGTYLTVFQTAIGNTFQPDIYETTIKKQWKKYAKFCTLQIVLIASIAFIFILLAPYIISILTAGRYTASTPFAQIIALSTITSAIYYLINNYSIATNRPRLYLYTSIIGSILIVIAMPLAVDRWEFYGGAWVMVLSYIIFSIINLLLLIFIKQPKN